MAKLDTILKFGYMLIIISILLMIWVSRIETLDIDRISSSHQDHPPCYFNPQCTCSKALPSDLGIVQCKNVALPNIPKALNMSKVFMLQLTNNDLKWFEPYFLHGTGLYRLEVSHNPLGDISAGAFTGLERYLWELRLTHNQLIEVPTKSFRFLQKLRLLDLSGNDISSLEPEDWRGLESSLQILIIADNSISKLSADTFSGLPLLETLDLRGNNIKSVDPNVFRDGLAHLSKVLLGDNQLIEIPYLALASLRLLRYLDLSKNLITDMVRIIENESDEENDQPPLQPSTPLSLDTLRLDYNQITTLYPGSFQYFNVLNNTYLNGNPISVLENSAFRNAKIRDLYLRDCRLTTVNPEAFDGLEGSLQTLDLSGNNITSVTVSGGVLSSDSSNTNNNPEMLFTRFQALQTLSLKDNLIQKLNPVELFNGFQYTLLHLDLSGKDNSQISLQELRRLRILRSLKLSRLMQTQLGPEDFLEFSVNLDELYITDSNLKTIKNHAFMHIRGLKLLDLSENKIDNLEPDCFSEIGHSLVSLNLGHGLSSNVKEVPSKVFEALTNLQYLNIANNYFNKLSDTSFYFLRNIKEIHLEDNKIPEIHKGTFQGDIHNGLEEIYLSFNNIELIEQHTFVDLLSLQYLYLDDNKIKKINRRAFMNLDRLKYLTLRGNKLAQINDESFQNLPELEYLDLAYNSLPSFNFDCFDQVGQLSSAFKVNISHNLINQLRTNFSIYSNTFNGGQHDMSYNQYYLSPVIHSNIKILDVSYNNITHISRGYFRPVELSLTHLYLSNNQIQNITRDVFNNIPHLQSLDLSDNVIQSVDYDAFKNTKSIQILSMSNNQLENLHVDTFHTMHELRVLDLSNNKFRSLPDQLIPSDNIEILNLSNNQFNKISILSILTKQAAHNLCELDLSNNYLTSLAYSDSFQRLQSLLWLDLSNNQLLRIDDGAFSQLPRLIHLDLSNNQNLDILDGGYSFRGLEHTLLELKLNNVSLTTIPDLPFYHLRLLSISGNELPTVPTDISQNITKTLRYLDLSSNDLTAIPLIIHSLTILRYLSLANNPITTITNATFNSIQINNTLEELDLRQLALSTFESGALSNFDSLRTLHLSVQKKLLNFNIPKVLNDLKGLKNLHIQVDDETNLSNEMSGKLPNKLQNITFSGYNLRYLDENILKGVQNSILNVVIKNTSINNINIKLFKNLIDVRNITIWIENNGTITHIDNPSTGDKPNLSRNTFLTSLHISGKGFKCDCQLGWIEVWERKKRQYLCGNNNILSTTSYVTTKDNKDNNIDCRLVSDELRNTICINDKNNNSIIDVFKSEIECGWGSYGHTNQDHTAFTAPILIAFITLLRIF